MNTLAPKNHTKVPNSHQDSGRRWQELAATISRWWWWFSLVFSGQTTPIHNIQLKYTLTHSCENTHKHNQPRGGMQQSKKQYQKGQLLGAVATGHSVATEENGKGQMGLHLYQRKEIAATSFPFFLPPQLSRRRASSSSAIGVVVVARLF